MAQKKNENSILIFLENIKKTYKTTDVATPVLKGISMAIRKGEFITIIGPSGSGKSTLMNIIGLLDTPTHGKYTLDSEDVTGLTENELAFIRNKKIGFVFQSFNLLPRATALDNVILPAIYAGVEKKERGERAKRSLELVGLSEKFYNKPNQLSGGQQQRVAIARAFMNDPELLLADEPTGNLDTKSGQDVIGIFKKLHKQGRTIILITHEVDIARVAERVIKIRDGIIEI